MAESSIIPWICWTYLAPKLCHLHVSAIAKSLVSHSSWAESCGVKAAEGEWPDGRNVKMLIADLFLICSLWLFLNMYLSWRKITGLKRADHFLVIASTKAYKCFPTVGSIVLIKNSICTEESDCCVRENRPCVLWSVQTHNGNKDEAPSV